MNSYATHYQKPRSNGTKIVLIILGCFLLLAVVGCIIGIAAVYMTMKPIVDAVDSAEKEVTAKSRARTLVLQMHNYHDANRRLPPAYSTDPDGKPLHSWRTLLLSYLGCPEASQIDFAKPWNDPANLSILKSIDASEYFESPRGSGHPSATHFVAIVDTNTTIKKGRSLSFSKISSGTSNTLLIVEYPESDIPWYEPRDLNVEQAVQMLKNSTMENGLVMAMADSSVKVVRTDNMDEELMRKLMDPEKEIQ